MDELIERLATSQLTWATASVIIAVVLRPVLVTLVEVWKASKEALTKIESERLENEKAQTIILGELKDELIINRGIQNQLITSVNTIPTTLQNMQDMMIARVGEGDRKREAIHTDIKTIPGEVWRLGDPRLDNLREYFGSIFSALESNIIAQLDPKAQNARAAVREELAGQKAELDKIVKRLNEIYKTLKSLPTPAQSTPQAAAKVVSTFDPDDDPPPDSPVSEPLEGGAKDTGDKKKAA